MAKSSGKQAGFRRENLILLVRGLGNCSLDISPVDGEVSNTEHISIDEKSGRWTVGRMPFAIGGIRYVPNGVIGVFDRNNDDHLKAMMSAAQEIALHQFSCLNAE